MSDTPVPIWADIQPDYLTFNPDVPSVEDPETKQRYYLTNPPTHLRDLALGRVMDTFGHLEYAMYQVLDNLLGLKVIFEARDIFYNILDQHKLRDVITNVSVIRLDSEAHEELGKLLDKSKAIATKRNRIVHGIWEPCYEIRGAPGKDFRVFSYWVRKYIPTNRPEREELTKTPPDPKTFAKYCFRIKRLHDISDEVAMVVNSVYDLLRRYSSQFPRQLPPQPPQFVSTSVQDR